MLAPELAGSSAAVQCFAAPSLLAQATLGLPWIACLLLAYMNHRSTISLLLGGIVLAPKLLYFKDSITLGDVMESLYGGRYAKIGTGVIGFLFSVLIVGSQIWALGYIGAAFLEMAPERAIWGIGLILILYSSMGSIRSVAITDVLQFLALTLIVSMMANMTDQPVRGTSICSYRVPVLLVHVVARGNLFICVSELYGSFWIALEIDSLEGIYSC